MADKKYENEVNWEIPSVGWQAGAHADAQAIAVASGVARTKDASEGKMTFLGS